MKPGGPSSVTCRWCSGSVPRMNNLSLVRPARTMPKSSRNSSCLSRSGERMRPHAMSLTLMTGMSLPPSNSKALVEDTTLAARGLYVSTIEGAPPGLERRAQPFSEAAPLGRTEEGAEGKALPVRGEKQPVLPFRALFEDDAQPDRLEAPAALFAVNADPLDIERALGQPHGF